MPKTRKYILLELSEIENPSRVHLFSVSHYTFLVGSVKNCLTLFITPTPEIPCQITGLGTEIPSVRQSTNNLGTIYAKTHSKKVKYNKKSRTSSKNLYLKRPCHRIV